MKFIIGCFQAVCHSGRQSSDSYNDETFGSSECLSQEMAGGERRRKGKITWPYSCYALVVHSGFNSLAVQVY